MTVEDRETSTPQAPTDLTRRWVRYVVGFSVGVTVGLAPFLGVLKVPLFTPLLALYPVTLQTRLIPLSGAVMGLAAVTIQWYAAERLSRTWLRRSFLVFLVGAGLALVLLLFVRAAFVVDVPIRGGEEQAAFVVGWSRLATCPCTESSDPLCIRNTLTLNPAQIETCWNSRAVRFGELLLQFNYLAFVSCFGAITGLIVLRESAGRRPH